MAPCIRAGKRQKKAGTPEQWEWEAAATKSQCWPGCIHLLHRADGLLLLPGWPGLKESPQPHEEWAGSQLKHEGFNIKNCSPPSP